MRNTLVDPKAIRQGEGDNGTLRWSIGASSGRGRLVCCGRPSPTDREIVCSMLIETDHWERDKPLSVADIVLDSSVSLPQVIISRSALMLLLAKMRTWLLVCAEFSVELGTGGRASQTLSMSLGRTEELIYSSAKPACAISYSAGASISATWAFVVDQSCVSQLVTELEAFLGLEADSGRGD